MKFLYFTDPHLRGTTPASRIDNFPQTLEQKLEEISYLAQTHQVEAILCGGDLWDIPLPAIQTASNYIEILLTAGCPIYAIEGNHDLFGQNPETLSRTMLGLMFSTGLVKRLAPGEPVFFDHPSKNVRVQLTGQGYHFEIDKRDPRLDYCVKKARKDLVNYAIHLVHGMLLDKPIFGDVPTTLVEHVAPYTEADLTLCGHAHMGFTGQHWIDPRTDQDRYFMNIGGLTRVSNRISEMQRIPQVLLIDFSSGQMELIRIPLKCAKPGQKVLDRSKLEAAAAREEKLSSFAATVQEAGEFRGVNLGQVVDEVTQLNNLSGEVRAEGLRRIALAEEELAEPGVSGVHGYEEGGERPYITEVNVVNFQSHHHTRLFFGPGLNVLVGPSDQGKTAVLRALRWLFFNEPKGTDFFRIGATTCCVGVSLSNGVGIVRDREKSSHGYNRYTLYLPTLPGQPEPTKKIFEGFGNEIPAEILAAHGVREVRLDLDLEANLSMARQLDGPFLLSLAGAARAKAIGRLSGVHVIDAGIRAVSRDTGELAKEQRQLSGQTKDLNEQLKSYADLPIMKMRVAKIGRSIDRLEELERRTEHYRGLLVKWQEIQAKKAQAQAVIKQLDNLLWAETMLEALESLNATIAKKMDLGMRWQETQRQKVRLQACVEKTAHVDQAEKYFLVLGTQSERIRRLSYLATTRNTLQANRERVNIVLDRVVLVNISEEHANHLEGYLTQIKQATRLTEALGRVREELAGCRKAETLSQDVEVAEDYLVDLEALNGQGRTLAGLAGRRMAIIRERGGLIVNSLEPTEGVEAAEERLEQLAGLVERGKALKRISGNWQRVGYAAEKTKSAIEKAHNTVNFTTDNYASLLAEIGKCPTCAGPITQEKIQELVQELAS